MGCTEPNCSCTAFNGTAEAPFCQTCGHARSTHPDTSTRCRRCDCVTFSGAPGTGFCVGCGHARDEHGMVATPSTAAEQPPSRSSRFPLAIAVGIGAVVLVAIAVLLALVLRAGPFSNSGTAATATTTTATTTTTIPEPASVNRIGYTTGPCARFNCPAYWANSNGTSERPTPAKGWVDSMAPDGSRMIVKAYQNNRFISHVVTLDSVRVRAFNSDLSNWSPNSKWLIADDSSYKSHNLTIVNAETLEPITIPLPNGESVGYYKWWSPDSQHLLLATNRYGSDGASRGNGLQMIDVQSHNVTTIVPARRHDILGATWSPDGSAIAYASRAYVLGVDGGGSDEPQIWIDRIGDAEKPTQLAYGTRPIWGPTLIAYNGPTSAYTDSNGYSHTRSQIWTVNPAEGGSSAAQLTSFVWGRHNERAPGPTMQQWLPDGSGIVGLLPNDQAYRGFVFSLKSHKMKLMRDPTSETMYSVSIEAVSKDSKSVLISDPNDGDSVPVYFVYSIENGTTQLYLKSAKSLAVSTGWMP